MKRFLTLVGVTVLAASVTGVALAPAASAGPRGPKTSGSAPITDEGGTVTTLSTWRNGSVYW